MNHIDKVTSDILANKLFRTYTDFVETRRLNQKNRVLRRTAQKEEVKIEN